MRPNALEFAQSRGAAAAEAAGPGAHVRGPAPLDVGDRPRRGHRRGAAVRPLRRPRDRGVPRVGARRPGPRERLPPARERALPHRHRPRHLRAHRARRPRVGRRADLARRGRLHRAADGLQAGGDQGPPPGRRRPPLDHERRPRGRGGRQVRDRGEPARALRERLPEGDPDDARQPRAPRRGHGLPADRLPGVQAARPPAPARGGGALEGEVPGRRHHPDRARPERRADVRDEHPQLHPPRGDRPPRLRVGDPEAGRGLRPAQGHLREARHRDLRHPRPQGREEVRRGAREDSRLAPHPRADHGRAPAAVQTQA